jgi:uncharacterized protein YgiM (DUF1202 family)
MKARILDPQVNVYSSMEENSISIATLKEGSEIEFGSSKKKAGKVWVPITLSTGQQAYIPGETHIYVIREGALLQNNVDMHAEPSSSSSIKQKLNRNDKVSVLQVVKEDGEDWVRIRDANGSEGFIGGNTRIRVLQQKTKAQARKNMLTGVMWIIAGIVIVYPNFSVSSGGTITYLGYAALLFGVGMLVMGIYQLVTSPV